jgi:hypothetical protein
VKVLATLAAVLAAAGIALLLLAVDVHRWQSGIAAGDVAYRTRPGAADWTPSQLLPGGLARSLLHVADDVRAREALRAFKGSHPRRGVFLTPVSIVHARTIAQTLLTRAAADDRDAARRSQELNLAAVYLMIALDPFDPGARSQSLVQAADGFRAALASDPANADAAYNLELTLRLLAGHGPSGRAQEGRSGPHASSVGAGSGY